MDEYNQEALFRMQQDSWNRYVLENTGLLEDLSHLLKGEIQVAKWVDEEGEKVLKTEWEIDKNEKPPMNSKGYYFTMLQMSKALNKTNSTGNIGEEKAMLLVNQVMKGIVSRYIIEIENFDLVSTSNIRNLRAALSTLLVMHFSKSINMKLIDKLTTTTNISEQKISSDQKPMVNMTA